MGLWRGSRRLARRLFVQLMATPLQGIRGLPKGIRELPPGIRGHPYGMRQLSHKSDPSNRERSRLWS